MPIFKDSGREKTSGKGGGSAKETRRVVAVKKQMDCIKNSFDAVFFRASPTFCGIPVSQGVNVRESFPFLSFFFFAQEQDCSGGTTWQ